MRLAKSFGASEAELWEMCNRAPEADLGGGVYKFRLAREGEGKSGGARSIVAMKKDDRAVMVFGFEQRLVHPRRRSEKKQYTSEPSCKGVRAWHIK